MVNEDILDNFEILEPPKRTAIIKGETIDVSFIPARVALKFISFSKKHDVKKLECMTEDSFDGQMLDDIIEIVGMICERSNKKVTACWLLDNVDIASLMAFVKFAFAGLTKIKPEGVEADGKN